MNLNIVQMERRFTALHLGYDALPKKEALRTVRSFKPRLGTVAKTAVAGVLGIYAFKSLIFRNAAGKPLEICDPPEPGGPEFVRLIEALTQATQRPGNRVTVLRNGLEIFPAMLEQIEKAEQNICLSAYIWWSGEAADNIGAALARRARDGVQVNVLLDSWGSAKLNRGVVAMLEQAGAQVAWFRPLRSVQIGKANNRMHRRILVIDGRVAFAGGVGIAEPWEGDCEEPGRWRESHVRVEGPAVRDLAGGFLENWSEATGQVLDPSHFPPLLPLEGGVPVLVTRSSATGGNTSNEYLFLAAIAGARRRLWITTAYFAPHRGFVDALCAAAGRGVDVRVLVNGRPIDKEVVRKAGQRSYGRLLKAGVRMFEYQKARLHAKVMIVDDGWANVGSANFDNRSFALEEEINVSIESREIAQQLAAHFLDDLNDSKEMDLERWKNRPLLPRMGELASEAVRQSL